MIRFRDHEKPIHHTPVRLRLRGREHDRGLVNVRGDDALAVAAAG
jgi:hypothetical protein